MRRDMIKSMDGFGRSAGHEFRVKIAVAKRNDFRWKLRNAFNSILDWFFVY